MSEDGSSGESLLRVVRGQPTPEDLAVIAALVSVASGSPDRSQRRETARQTRGHWTDPRLLARRQLYPGPGAWRTATWG